MSARSPIRCLPLLLLLLVTLVACQPKTPAEKVAAARASYVVELNSWFPQEPEPEPLAEPVEGEDAADGEAAAEEPAEEAAAEGEATEGEAADGDALEVVDVDDVAPRQVNIFFDLIVLFEGDDPLPGLTLEVSQADSGGAEKQSWRHYQELSAHIKGETKQESFTLEGVEFTEGDQFSVTVRKVVPPEEHGEYREFASAGE